MSRHMDKIWLDTARMTETQHPAPDHPPRASRRRTWWYALAAAVVAALAVGGFLLGSGSGEPVGVVGDGFTVKSGPATLDLRVAAASYPSLSPDGFFGEIRVTLRTGRSFRLPDLRWSFTDSSGVSLHAAVNLVTVNGKPKYSPDELILRQGDTASATIDFTSADRRFLVGGRIAVADLSGHTLASWKVERVT